MMQQRAACDHSTCSRRKTRTEMSCRLRVQPGLWLDQVSNGAGRHSQSRSVVLAPGRTVLLLETVRPGFSASGSYKTPPFDDKENQSGHQGENQELSLIHI